MRDNVILLYSDPADPVVQTAKQCRSYLPGLHIVGYDRLLKHLQPAPWPQMVQSDFPADLRELFKDAVVVNRLFCFDPTIASTALMLQAQHEMWLHIAVAPLLETARQLTHDTSVRGVSMTLQPLNLQWFHLGAEPSLGLPSFVFGFGAEDPDISGLSDPLQKSIWSLFDWKAERHLPQKEANWHKFFVQRPIGTPVICHYFGERSWCSFPRGEVQVDSADLARIAAIVRRTFKSELGEFLVYKEADRGLCFHAFSPHMTSAVDTPTFSDRLTDWLGQLAKVASAESV